MSEKARIEDTIRPVIEASGAFLVDLTVRGQHEGKVIEVFVDTDDGITTGSCADLSRHIIRAIDSIETLKGRFSLVVSSPGLERPIKYPRQYPRNVGRIMVVKHRTDGRTDQVIGELVGSFPTHIVLRSESGEMITVPYEAILEARVRPRW